MPVPVATLPDGQAQVQGQTDPSGSFFDNLANPNVLSGMAGMLPGPLGYAGSALGAIQPTIDTIQGNQSAESSLTGLFGGGVGGILGHVLNWVTGQATGDTTGMTDTSSPGIGEAPGFMERNFGSMERAVQHLFGGSGGGAAPTDAQSFSSSPAGPQVTASSPQNGTTLQPAPGDGQPPAGSQGQPGQAGYNPNLEAGNAGPLAGLVANANGMPGAGFGSLSSSVSGGWAGSGIDPNGGATAKAKYQTK